MNLSPPRFAFIPPHPAPLGASRAPLHAPTASDFNLTFPGVRQNALWSRAEHKRRYTDCFAAALAATRKASLATSGDLSRSRREDFAHVEKMFDIP